MTKHMICCSLPEEIMVEIFSRLPTKSAGKCRCLSKYWCTYLSTTEFINLHLKNHRNQENNTSIILVAPNHFLHVITSPLKNDAVVSKIIDFPPIGNTFWAFFRSSCNGLVLLQNTERKLFLVNPVTLQLAKIPDSNSYYLQKTDRFELVGFGYDTSCDDYKVVKLSWFDDDKGIAYIDIYSVRRGAWKRVVVDKSPGVRPPAVWHPFMPFVNGALHWLTRSSGQYLIVGFDLEYEVFRELPISIDVPNVWPMSGLFVLGGCLCIKVDRSSVWMMKDYGVVDSCWIKYPINTNGALVHVTLTPLCFVSDDEFFCLGNVNEWFVYNVKDQMAERVVVGGRFSYFRSVGIFVDSLVSLDQYVPSS